MRTRVIQLVTILLLMGVLAACGAAETPVLETAVPALEAPATDAPEVVVETAVDQPVVQTSGVITAESETAVTAVQTVDEEVVTQSTYIDLYERVNPSVVNIRVVGSLPGATQGGLPDLFPEIPEDHPPFGLPQGQGSGFVYDADGHIITNNHVIAGAQRVVVTFADGTEAEAEVIGADPGSDLAVIKVNPDEALLQPVTLADSDSLRVGQLVAAIGNPFGLDGSMSTGIISGLGRLLGSGAVTPSGDTFSIPNIIQTDTAINPGNSGGPLLNLDGAVVGVNTAIRSSTGGFQGIGYAVPANTVQRVAPQLIENGRVDYPWLGIRGGTLTSDLAQAMDLEAGQRGVLVVDVVADSPADKAGLRGGSETVTIDGSQFRIGGDVIVSLNGEPVTGIDNLIAIINSQTAVGDTVSLQILRDGELQDVAVTMEARPVQD